MPKQLKQNLLPLCLSLQTEVPWKRAPTNRKTKLPRACQQPSQSQPALASPSQRPPASVSKRQRQPAPASASQRARWPASASQTQTSPARPRLSHRSWPSQPNQPSTHKRVARRRAKQRAQQRAKQRTSGAKGRAKGSTSRPNMPTGQPTYAHRNSQTINTTH